MTSKDNLGDKLKDLENIETSKKAIKGIPLMARLDGRSFSKFTKGLKRPYDERMSQLMIDTAKYLVENTQACIGYTKRRDHFSMVSMTMNLLQSICLTVNIKNWFQR